jgi:hypothetical protein
MKMNKPIPIITFSAKSKGKTLEVDIPNCKLSTKLLTENYSKTIARDIRENGVECSEEALNKLIDKHYEMRG